MTQQALPAGPPRRRRALMGLLDADGWTWAGLKATFWFVLMILLLAYIPDRAYYLTVGRTVDLGLLAWSPVNFCPPENKDLPCPAPVGAVIPWDPSPAELALPAPRESGATAQVGVNLLYIGGSDGSGPTTTTFTTTIANGSYTSWTAGPELPEARSGAAAVSIGSTIYLLGGTGPDGATDTIWSLTYDQEAKSFGDWTPVEGLTLPAARTSLGAIPVSDGLLVAGGFDADGKPTTTVWKSTLDSEGALGAFSEQAALLDGVANATMAQVGDYVWVWGGTDANGPSGAVQRGTLAQQVTNATPGPNPVTPPLELQQWAVADAYNLPGARTASAGFAANGAMYVVGGEDGSGARPEVYWTVPNASGNIDAWKHLDQTDLPGGLSHAAATVSGSHVFVIGGATEDGIQSGAIRADLAPQEPFFQLGLVGVVVPGLKIDGEIGQQLGYLNAFGAGGVGSVFFIIIGWAYAHPETVRRWIDRRRARRRS